MTSGVGINLGRLLVISIVDDDVWARSGLADLIVSLGYEVRPIDCTTVWQRGGTLHCLVNVLGRVGSAGS